MGLMSPSISQLHFLVFLLPVVYLGKNLTIDFLLEAFYHFKTITFILQKAKCDEFDPNDEELLYVLSRDNISVIVSQLVHQELIQKPRYISNC